MFGGEFMAGNVATTGGEVLEARADSPSGAATSVIYNGQSTEMMVAYAGAEGDLHTLQFRESRGDLGEVELLKAFDWRRKAPLGAALLIPEAGHFLARLDEFWLMWRVGNTFYGQSVHHPVALGSVVVEGERLIDRPMVAANQELHAYAWRGGTLVRHRYAARPGEEAPVRVEMVREAPAQPARSICAPVPADDSGTAMIAYVDETKAGLEASALYVRGDKVMQVSGKTEGRYRLLSRNRMGVHVGIRLRPAVAVVAESYDDGTYVLLEARFDLAKNECFWNRTKIESVPKGHLQSTAAYFYKTQDSPEAFVVAVDNAGHLISPGRRNVQVIRENVRADYGYPILTTFTSRYEATGKGSEIKLAMF